MSSLDSKKLQRLIIAYSALGILSIGALVAAIGIIPLYNRLREDTERNFQFSLRTRRRTIDEFLLRAQDIALQITSRTRARQVLEDYNQGKVQREDILAFTSQILTEALTKTDNIRGIIRLDRQGQLLARVGRDIPTQSWNIPPLDSPRAALSNPFQRQGNSYLVVSAPIINPQSRERVGTDIVLFDISSLEQILQQNSGLETEELILGAIANDRLEIFFPQNATNLNRSSALEQIFRQGITSENAEFFKRDRDRVFAFEPILESRWGLVIKIDRQELYASVNQQVMAVAIAIVFCCLLGTGGTIVLLRPLTGKVIVRTDELEEKVRSKTFALQELKQAQVHLIQQEKMATLGQLVSGIAHEINNPISFIYGNITHAEQYNRELFNLLDLYQKYYPHPEREITEELETIELDFLKKDLADLLRSMESGADRIQKIVLSLRNFSRLDEADLKTVDIHEGIRSTLTIVQHRLQETGNRPEIKVITNYGELPPISCYPGLLNQVFLHLLGNAIEAIEEKNNQGVEKIAGEIKIRTATLGDRHITIQIADNGIGMTEETRKYLFEPFFTTKIVGKGTGLGLPISHSIIEEKHNGTLRCDSQWGEGTNFTIEIPLQLQSHFPAIAASSLQSHNKQ